RPCGRRILSPLRLPVPPPRRAGRPLHRRVEHREQGLLLPVDHCRSPLSTTSITTRASVLAGFAASSPTGAVSRDCTSATTSHRNGIFLSTDVTSSRPKVTTKLPFT